MVKPLLAALQRITAALPASAGASDGGASLRLLLSSARLVSRVFFSLNSPGLTEVSWNNTSGIPDIHDWDFRTNQSDFQKRQGCRQLRYGFWLLDM